MLDQRRFARSVGFVQNHSRGHLFAQRRMRATEGDYRRDRGMPKQNLVDFMGRNVLASTNDDVLNSTGQMQIAVRVEESFVTGTKPSIHKRTGVGFRIIFVSAEYVRSLNGNFSPLIGGEVIALLVHDADAQPGAHADRPGLAVSRRQWIRGHLVSSFGHSVGFDEGYAKQILDLANKLCR